MGSSLLSLGPLRWRTSYAGRPFCRFTSVDGAPPQQFHRPFDTGLGSGAWARPWSTWISNGGGAAGDKGLSGAIERFRRLDGASCLENTAQSPKAPAASAPCQPPNPNPRKASREERRRGFYLAITPDQVCSVQCNPMPHQSRRQDGAACNPIGRSGSRSWLGPCDAVTPRSR